MWQPTSIKIPYKSVSNRWMTFPPNWLWHSGYRRANEDSPADGIRWTVRWSQVASYKMVEKCQFRSQKCTFPIIVFHTRKNRENNETYPPPPPHLARRVARDLYLANPAVFKKLPERGIATRVIISPPSWSVDWYWCRLCAFICCTRYDDEILYKSDDAAISKAKNTN